jgi:sugar lactone lactonase YvrE
VKLRLAAFAVAFALPALAVTTRTWRVTTYKDLDEGEASGVLLSSLGDASSGFGASRVDVPEAEVFASAVAPDGTVWLGTGDQAQLYSYDGKSAKKAVKLDGVLVASIAAAPDGTIYAGTVPGGKIFAVKPGQNGAAGATARELCKLDGAEHIWALAVDGPKKTLYAATGPNGRLYAIDTTTGKNRVFWDSGEKHVLSLLRQADGTILAGSSDEAILYRVGSDGTARALHDFDGDEVRAIASYGTTLYVAVNEFEKKPGSSTAASSPSKAHGTKIVLPSGPTPTPVTPAPPGRDRKGKGAIYRVDLDGRVEQLHALADSYFTSLAVDREGNLFAAAGANGRVYLVRPDRTVLTALDLPERQILTLALDGKHPLLGTGDAGAIYTIDFAPPRDATYTSKVFDASFPARWGLVRWSASGGLAMETRSGNTARPDRTWSAWQPPTAGRRDATEGKIASPVGRYLQFRAHFQKGAVLRDVTSYYLPQNQRARVTEITVGDDPNGKLAKAARAAGKPRSPIVRVKWKVENPDEDELVYRLWFREESDLNWKPLGGPDPLTRTEFDWNTEAIPDGNYLLKVVASDERANPSETALDHALSSNPFLIDNRKPEVGGLVVSYPFVSGAARDSFSPITEIAFSVDGGDFQPMAPRDAVLDDLVEDFSLRLPAGLTAGTHTLAIRAADAADNVGAAQVSFRVK